MTYRQAAIIALIGITTASCGGNNPPEATPQAHTPLTAPQSRATTPQAAPHPAAETQESRPVPPRDAQWTIYCRTLTGPNHVREARRLRDHLMETTGLKQWYLVHGSTETTLYHGYYRAFDDPTDPATRQAQRELEQVQQLRDPSGRRLFRQAFFVGIDAGDPEAPSEWNLLNSGGYYTLEIGVYTGSIERKQAAVDAVREARAQGIPAYYYHGENASSVCIGAWGPEAAETAAPVVNDDSRKTVVVATDRPTGKMADTLRQFQQSDKMITVAPQFIPKDPTMIEMMKRFPHRYINGEVHMSRIRDPKTGRIIEVPDPSFLVMVPKRSQNILMQETQIADDSAAPADQPLDYGTAIYGPPQQKPVQQRSTGRLRSLTD